MARDGQGYPRRRRDMMMMKLRLKIDLVSYLARAEGLVNMISKLSSEVKLVRIQSFLLTRSILLQLDHF